MVQDRISCPLTKGEKILVALDGSQHTDAVVGQAISMGRICKSVIHLMSVIDFSPRISEIGSQLEKKLSKEARNFLKNVKSRIEKENIVCKTIVRIERQPHEAIVNEAKKKNIDLIIIGTRGKTKLEKMLVGSVAQKVIGTAPCPVMVVPV